MLEMQDIFGCHPGRAALIFPLGPKFVTSSRYLYLQTGLASRSLSQLFLFGLPPPILS